MKNREPSSDWLEMAVTAVIFVIPPGLLIVAICASFAHIKDWALKHAPVGTHAWQGWAFASIVELIPIFGVLVMWKLRKVGHPDLTVPRWLLAGGFILSMAGQIAYAGGLDAGLSRLLVAAGPSVAGLILTEVLLWLLRAILPDDAKVSPPVPGQGAVPPPPMTLPQSPLANVPPASVSPSAAVPLDTEPEPEPLSPWTSPPGTPLPDHLVPQDTKAEISVVSPQGQEDKPQATTLVPPSVSPSAGGVDMVGQDLPATQDTTALSPTESGGHDPQDTPGEDTAQGEDTSGHDGGTSGLDPIDLEMWQLSKAGMTKPQLAVRFGVSEKTIQRRLGKVRKVIETTDVEEEYSNA